MKLRLAASICVLLLFLAVSASASPVGFLGSGSSGTLTATLVSLTWNVDSAACSVPLPTCNAPNALPWNEDVNSGTALSFNGCSGVLGTSGCLFQQEAISINNGTSFCGGTNTTTCPTGPEMLPQPTFIQFIGNGTAHANVVYELTTVGAGSSTNCLMNPNVTCSIAGSPVVLTPGPAGTTVSINLFGIASDNGVPGLTQLGHNSTWQGGFSAFIAGQSITDILNIFCPGGVCNPDNTDLIRGVSGNFTATAIPEPGTVSMILIGVALVTLSQVRRRTRKA